jgi:hypothetical protein
MLKEESLIENYLGSSLCISLQVNSGAGYYTFYKLQKLQINSDIECLNKRSP